MPNKIESNVTGLSYAEEATPGVLPGSPTWYVLEPNSYGDFGSQVTTTARATINSSRQRRKGVVTDVNANANFMQDLTFDNMYDLLQGFMFASWRQKDVDAFTAVTGSNGFTLASGGTDYRSGDLILASGSVTAANNGVHKVTTGATGTNVPVTSTLTADASPDATSKIRRIGFEFASGDAVITVTNGVPSLKATTKNLTQLGVIAGEWFWVGGDTSGTNFATATNYGWVRAGSVAAGEIVLDKTQNTFSADTGTGKTLRVFLGDVLKNEADPTLQVKRTYQLERSLGAAGYEYGLGSTPNQLVIQLNSASKVTLDLGFVCHDFETAGSAKSGTRATLVSGQAFNTSSDFGRIRLEDVDMTGLASFMIDAQLTINNGVTPDKALGTLGAFDTSYGDFAVTGNVNAYFSTTAAVDAVRSNADVSLDFALVHLNTGLLFDIPLVTLGNARLQVEKDRAIRLPLSLDAASHATFDHTLLAMSFAYLPDAAM